MGELRLMANGRIKALDKTEQETIIQYTLGLGGNTMYRGN